MDNLKYFPNSVYLKRINRISWFQRNILPHSYLEKYITIQQNLLRIRNMDTLYPSAPFYVGSGGYFAICKKQEVHMVEGPFYGAFDWSTISYLRIQPDMGIKNMEDFSHVIKQCVKIPNGDKDDVFDVKCVQNLLNTR